ncbi:MAG: flavodoxin domain-containing protein [Candidatus Eisenbacteria bacterium]
MLTSFGAVKISEHVHWVGAVDWEIRDFHGYATDRGTTYNAYLILADKITLVDSVKAPFRDELLARIASVVDPSDISVIVSNHSEMDHSGCLPDVVDLIQPEQVFASKMGVKALQSHFHGRFDVTPVEDGGTLSLGDVELQFMETRMLHWPDSMFTYLPADEVLFSQDAFGMHLASTERFDDGVDDSVLNDEAAKYYANILMPYSPMVRKLLARVKELNLPFKLVAPDHGPIWRSKFGMAVENYERWSEQKPTLKAVVVYDTMWGSTAKMARAIADGLAAGGARPSLVPLQGSHRSDVAAELLEAGALLVGTPTINNNMFPSLGDVFLYLQGLRPRNLIGAAFGSYGWSGEGVAQINAILQKMEVELVSDGLRVQFVPDEKDLDECRELGKSVAARLVEMVDG